MYAVGWAGATQPLATSTGASTSGWFGSPYLSFKEIRSAPFHSNADCSVGNVIITDDNAKTAYLSRTDSNPTEFWSYDEPRSVWDKSDYVVSNALAGVMFWALNFDDANASLLNAAYGRLNNSMTRPSCGWTASPPATPTPTPTPAPATCSSNLLQNPSFELNPSTNNWTNGWGTAPVWSTDAQSGAKSINVPGGGVVAQYVNVTQGQQLTLSGWGKLGSSATGALKIAFYDSNYSAVGNSSEIAISGSAYNQLSLPVTVPSGASLALAQIVGNTGSAGVFADNLCLGAGSNPLTVTPTPAPATCSSNLLQNPSFELNPSTNNWTNGWGTAPVWSTDAQSGAKSINVPDGGVVAQYVNVTQGQQLTLSGWGKLGSGATGALKIAFYDSNYSAVGNSSEIAISGSAYNQLSLPITVPSGASLALVQVVGATGSAGVFADNLCFGAGSTPPTATPTPTPASSNQFMIFNDAWTAGWSNGSWDTTLNFANTNPIYSGANSIAATYTTSGAAFAAQTGNAINTAGYTQLKFWAHGGSSGTRPIRVAIQPVVGGTTSAWVDLNVPANGWSLQSIPLSNFGNPSNIGYIMIQNNAGTTQPVFYIDELQLSN